MVLMGSTRDRMWHTEFGGKLCAHLKDLRTKYNKFWKERTVHTVVLMLRLYREVDESYTLTRDINYLFLCKIFPSTYIFSVPTRNLTDNPHRFISPPQQKMITHKSKYINDVPPI